MEAVKEVLENKVKNVFAEWQNVQNHKCPKDFTECSFDLYAQELNGPNRRQTLQLDNVMILSSGNQKQEGQEAKIYKRDWDINSHPG